MVEPIRVLHVLSGLERGGAEQVIMNWYRHIDRDRVQFDFVVENRKDEYFHEAEVRRLGGRVFRVPKPASNLLAYSNAWKDLFSRHPELRIVHGHHTSPATLYLGIARYFGRITIAHSHTAGGEPTLKDGLKRVLRRPLRRVAHHLWGCSTEANTWMFGTRRPSRVIPNAIDVDDFAFSNLLRTKLRDDLNNSDSVVVGHVGNFRAAKNHTRLLEIFHEFKQMEPRAHLLLVGDGALRPDIEKQILQLQIQESVTMAGVRNDIPEILMAMDLFLFPSTFEGLGVAIVEAQASGLGCVISDSITSEVVFSDRVEQISLDKSNHSWATALKQRYNIGERQLAYKIVEDAGYDAVSASRNLQDLYSQL